MKLHIIYIYTYTYKKQNIPLSPSTSLTNHHGSIHQIPCTWRSTTQKKVPLAVLGRGYDDERMRLDDNPLSIHHGLLEKKMTWLHATWLKKLSDSKHSQINIIGICFFLRDSRANHENPHAVVAIGLNSLPYLFPTHSPPVRVRVGRFYGSCSSCQLACKLGIAVVPAGPEPQALDQSDPSRTWPQRISKDTPNRSR